MFTTRDSSTSLGKNMWEDEGKQDDAPDEGGILNGSRPPFLIRTWSGDFEIKG